MDICPLRPDLTELSFFLCLLSSHFEQFESLFDKFENRFKLSFQFFLITNSCLLCFLVRYRIMWFRSEYGAGSLGQWFSVLCCLKIQDKDLLNSHGSMHNKIKIKASCTLKAVANISLNKKLWTGECSIKKKVKLVH